MPRPIPRPPQEECTATSKTAPPKPATAEQQKIPAKAKAVGVSPPSVSPSATPSGQEPDDGNDKCVFTFGDIRADVSLKESAKAWVSENVETTPVPIPEFVLRDAHSWILKVPISHRNPCTPSASLILTFRCLFYLF